MEIADGISVLCSIVHSFLLQDAATVGRVAEKADIVIPVATGKNHLLCLRGYPVQDLMWEQLTCTRSSTFNVQMLKNF
jgi:hypothetical protein